MRPSFSVELFPPKDELGEARLWRALDEIARLNPDFVSVTYGAGGSSRERSIRVTSEITKRTGIETVAHLTCVGATREELIDVLKSYRSGGVESILALRGDPPGGPRATWQKTMGGFDHSDQLVSLAREEGFRVGVAAFPDGHPTSVNFDDDIEVLLEKERRGASFATTQFFFESKKYARLVESLRARGSSLPVIAGILPITNLNQLKRMAELSGAPVPESIVKRIESATDVRETGVEIAIELSRELLEYGAAGLHFYTMNSAQSTMEIAKAVLR